MSTSKTLRSFLPKDVFTNVKYTYQFKNLKDVEYYYAIFDKMRLKETYSTPENLKVVNLYPGSGVLPVALQDYLNPSKQYLMDKFPQNVKHFQKTLIPALQKYSNKPVMELAQKDPFAWESYPELFHEGGIDIESQSRDHLHTNFLITCNYTNRVGEQLCVQHMNCAGNKNWLQKYGRVRLLAVVNPVTAAKFLLILKFKVRMGIQAEAYTDVKLVGLSEMALKQKFSSHPCFTDEFLSENDHVMIPDSMVHPSNDKEGIAILDFQPKNVPEDVDLDYFDYITKTLLTVNMPLEKCIDMLGFGALDYFSQQPEFNLILGKRTKELLAEEYFTLSKLFAFWPFKPTILLGFDTDEGDRTT